MNFKKSRMIASGMLLIAVLDLPYGYYTLLRIVVFIVAGIIAFLAFKNDKELLLILFGAISILYNPIIPVYLNKNTWIIIDVLVAVFVLSIFLLDTNDEAS